jgi:adenylate cyclase
MRAADTDNPTASGVPSYPEQLEQLQQLQMLLSLSRQVAALDSLDAVLDTLVNAAKREVGAEAGSLFLHDDETGELYTVKTTDLGSRQIRVLDHLGIVGAVYQSGVGEIVPDAYADPRFHRDVDRETGFTTESLICAPVKNAKGETIGAAEMLNKLDGVFVEADLTLVERLTAQCAITLESMQLVDRTAKSRRREIDFLNVVSDLTSELDLGRLLGKVMSEATRMLEADRSTLFLNDEKTGELFSYIGDKLETEIRFPNHVGIAGTVFTDEQSIRIPHAYADLRFNPEFDRRTGYFTRSILCVPIFNTAGKAIGVTQALNKRGGPFTAEDESRLRAFTAQIASSLENAKLFADVQAMKNYNESMLESMSNGVVTFDEGGMSQTCNAAGSRIMRRSEADVVGRPAEEVFDGNDWVIEHMQRVAETRSTELAMDAELVFEGERVSANVTVLPLLASDGDHLGTLVMIEDISSEKRVKSTLSRYMDPELADRLLAAGSQEDLLGGVESVATVLFSDVRGFTTISEQLGAHGTVAMLNDYFERMVDCITEQSGMLDKFIGDAIMAVFGLPIPREDDEDRALRASIAMIQSLRDWNTEREARSEPLVDMGIGLNTDSVVAGNIGSPKRMDYTIIGDGVNLASRLEGACKQYGARILISELTKAKLRGVYRLREVDKVVVKGKTKPVSVFECLDYHDEGSFPSLMETLGAYGEGLARYRDRDFERAAEWFETALRANPDDRLSRIYVERCRVMAETPPPTDWDGVWVMSEK